MFFINLKTEIVASILSFRKSRHKPNLESTSKYGFSPDLGGGGGGDLAAFSACKGPQTKMLPVNAGSVKDLISQK